VLSTRVAGRRAPRVSAGANACRPGTGPSVNPEQERHEPRGCQPRSPYDPACEVVVTIHGDTGSHRVIRNDGASCSRAERTVVAEGRHDCYLHGSLSGDFGDPWRLQLRSGCDRSPSAAVVNWGPSVEAGWAAKGLKYERAEATGIGLAHAACSGWHRGHRGGSRAETSRGLGARR
jgi:hypothetical protein